MPGAVLQDDERKQGRLGHVVVAPLAHRDALVQARAIQQRLTQRANPTFAFERDAQLLAHRARAAVATDQVVRGQHLIVSRAL